MSIVYRNVTLSGCIFVFFKQKTAYEILAWEFRRVLFRSHRTPAPRPARRPAARPEGARERVCSRGECPWPTITAARREGLPGSNGGRRHAEAARGVIPDRESGV